MVIVGVGFVSVVCVGDGFVVGAVVFVGTGVALGPSGAVVDVGAVDGGTPVFDG